jgi:hypothetical protein
VVQTLAVLCHLLDAANGINAAQDIILG